MVANLFRARKAVQHAEDGEQLIACVLAFHVKEHVQPLIQPDDHARPQYVGGQTKRLFNARSTNTCFYNLLGTKYVSLVCTTLLVPDAWRINGFSEVPWVKLSVSNLSSNVLPGLRV